MTPRLSVLMSVYNGGPYLSEAVESVLASDMADFQFVIVDNVSTDGSREWLRSLSDERITLIENETNLGQTGALNVGLQACAAPVVARLDADDICLPHRFTEQLKRLDADPALGLVGGQATRIDATGKTIGQTRLPTASQEIHARMLLQNCFVHSSVAFRRDAAMTVGLYPTDFAVSQDFALFSAIMRNGHRLENLGEPVCKLRAHPDQVMATGGRDKEIMENVRVAATNQAWTANRDENIGLAKTLNRLWSGQPAAENGEASETAQQSINRFFDNMKLTGRQEALLSLVILGGTCDGKAAIRWVLLRRAVMADPSILFRAEFYARIVRAMTPASRLPALRSMTKARP